MDDIPDLIRVDDKTLGEMAVESWCDLEEPLIAIPCEFKFDEEDRYLKGKLMVTHGAFYIFRDKMFRSFEFLKKFNLLEIKIVRLSFSDTEIYFTNEGKQNYFIKTEYIFEVAYATSFVIKTALYGITAVKTFNVVGDNLPECCLKTRPKNLMEYRTIFLAHFYGFRGDQLHATSYFKKWEDQTELDSMIIIGPSLHPGNFACAFGHSIAWEVSLKTVVFQNFLPSKFPAFFDAFIQNSITIKKVVFSDYSKKEKILNFPDAVFKRTSVKTFQFFRCVSQIVHNFVENIKQLPCLEDLILNKIAMNGEEFIQMVNLISDNQMIRNSLKYFEIVRTDVPHFPLTHFTRLLNNLACLETIAIRNLTKDASSLLTAICESNSPIRAIHINCMNFRRKLKKNIQFPATLMHLDVSYSAFSEEAYTSLLSAMTSYKLKIPIIFESISVSLNQPQTFQKFVELDFDHCFSNILEFNFSRNKFPDDSSRFLFALLFTQKHLRLLSLNQIEVNDPIDFLKNVLTLVASIKVPGLELSGLNNCFEPSILAQFIAALPVQAPHCFRTVSFQGCGAGDEGLKALTELIRNNKYLAEISADGFQPSDLNTLLEFWSEVVDHPNVVAVDYPEKDLQNLGVVVAKLSSAEQSIFDKLKLKKSPSTPGKRDMFLLKEIASGAKLTTTSEIFKKCAPMKYEENENDFATKEMSILSC